MNLCQSLSCKQLWNGLLRSPHLAQQKTTSLITDDEAAALLITRHAWRAWKTRKSHLLLLNQICVFGRICLLIFSAFYLQTRAATRLWHAHCYGKFAASSRLNLKGYFVRAADLAARLIIWDASGAVILSTKLLWSNTSQVGGTDTSL